MFGDASGVIVVVTDDRGLDIYVTAVWRANGKVWTREWLLGQNDTTNRWDLTSRFYATENIPHGFGNFRTEQDALNFLAIRANEFPGVKHGTYVAPRRG